MVNGNLGFGTVNNILLFDTIAQLANTDPNLSRSGQLAYTNSIRSYWTARPGDTTPADGITVVRYQAVFGSGRWFRLEQADPSWLTQSTWYIDPALGNDESDGLTAGTALKIGRGAGEADWNVGQARNTGKRRDPRRLQPPCPSARDGRWGRSPRTGQAHHGRHGID